MRLGRWVRVFGMGLVALMVGGCSHPSTSSLEKAPPAAKPELRVAAAADLQKAFTDLAGLYEKQNGQKVNLIFGSTGLLSKQIESGAPYDLFAAANESFVARQEKQGLTIAGTRRLYARGRLVLWTRKDSPPCPKALAELTTPRYEKIALANPEHAPYGMAAREALQSAKLWDTLKPRLVYGENVQQALQLAGSGNADVALLPLSLAIGGDGNYTLLDESLHRPLRQALVVLKASKQPEAARRFADLVTGPEGRALLQKYGFTLPDTP